MGFGIVREVTNVAEGMVDYRIPTASEALVQCAALEQDVGLDLGTWVRCTEDVEVSWVGCVDIQAGASDPNFVTDSMVLQVGGTLAGFEGANEGAGVDVEHGDGTVVAVGSGPDVLLPVRHDVIKAAITIGGSSEGVGVLAHLTGGDVGTLFGSVGTKGVDSVLAEKPHGVTHKAVRRALAEGELVVESLTDTKSRRGEEADGTESKLQLHGGNWVVESSRGRL
mmetsp:Transcript_26155/g.47510  ORF Transcript_26155/g.47510 Transcript_26155/m.47510 type:complete len:224 (+) Transcript_26155:1308-1979(+)